MKKTFLIICMMTATASAWSQLTLDQCKQLAQANYPAVKQYGLIDKSRDYNISNAAKNYLPQLSAGAGADFFADILDSPQLLSSFGGMKNELYNVNVQVNQTIYDGGATASKKRMATAQADVKRNQLDVSMYDINSRVEQIFFGILTLDEQIKQNLLLQKDIGISHKTVSRLIKGGLANQSDDDAVQVEQIKAQQNEGSLKTSRKAYVTMLGTFIRRKIDESTTFEKPYCDMNGIGSLQNNRPELEYYKSRGRLLDEERKALDIGLKPKVSAFGMGAYHNKVTGIMKNSLLAVGLTMSWNIGSLYTRKNDIHNIELERDQINSERETFLFNNRLQNENTNGNINNLRQQIKLDDEIIRLRENIRMKSEKKVENGTETVNEMLRDINAVNEARQNKAVHDIQLLKEIYNLKTINNN